MLYGRVEEQLQIRALLNGAAAGQSAATLIVAEPGAGKSALLDLAARMAGNSWLVLRCAGIENAPELPFGGLRLLLAPAIGHVDRLPGQQCAELRAVVEVLDTPQAADRTQVAVGTVSLLAELSNTQPVLCLIDDAHWLDQPTIEVLLSVTRRLGHERIAILLAGRPEFSGHCLPYIRLRPLGVATREVLTVARTTELRGRATATPIDRRNTVVERPETTRIAVLVAATEETGDLDLVLRVLADLGLTIDALEAAERSGVVTVMDQSIDFPNPLERTAVYRNAPFTQRLAVHAALAAALTDQPDRRAWHLAAAATGPDETAAAALEAVARRAGARTGCAGAAWERAARLSPDPIARARRLVAAAEAALDAGQHRRALELAYETIHSMDARPEERARLAIVRARVEFDRGSLRAAHRLLVDGAADLASVQPQYAARLLIGAATAAWTTGDLSAVASARIAMAELDLGQQRVPLLASVDGLLALHSSDHAAGVRLIRTNVRHTRSQPSCRPQVLVAVANQATAAGDLDDARDILVELARTCRELAMDGSLPAVDGALGTVEMLLGHFREAETALTEGVRIAQEVNQPNRVGQAESILAVIAAISGDEERCRKLTKHALCQASTDFNAIDIAHAEWALGLLDLGYGRYEAAIDRFEALWERPDRALGQWIHLMSDRVETAVRLRSPERAREPIAALEQWFAATHSPWIQAHLLRCRGMLDGNGEAYARALELHATEQRWFDHARTALLYGEWLRRDRSKTKARSVLRGAWRTFERLYAEPWAERARIELRAAGEATAPNGSDPAALLTPQELQVVRLAAAGATNKEIAARLLLSPKTVAHHLYRAFPKLGVTNRNGLTRVDLRYGSSGEY
ncbi:LuxR C-terminal-related transcriptional regulator [Nocardia sp. NPDC051463]|uniref:helix-turn-helix transcriptional regulator n=1 Tax=Nocardia sp. NPDC051463 TaxID=3154845 RepID=UPI003425CDFB